MLKFTATFCDHYFILLFRNLLVLLLYFRIKEIDDELVVSLGKSLQMVE